MATVSDARGQRWCNAAGTKAGLESDSGRGQGLQRWPGLQEPMAWTQVKRKDLAGFEGQQSVSLPVKQLLEQGRGRPCSGSRESAAEQNPKLIPRQVVPWATFWLMGGFTGQTCVSYGHRKIHFSILKCFGKLFQVTVSSSQAQWQDLKREEKVPLWGRETPGSLVLMGSRASHPRERSPCLNSTRLDYGNFCGQCLHTSQLTHSHADLPLLLLTVNLWNDDQWCEDLILCLRVLPLHYH